MSEGDDDWYDFPPAAHPRREAFTFMLAIICLIGLIGLTVWDLTHG